MRVHADENLKAEIVEGLRQAGHDVTYAAEFQRRADDDRVLDHAVTGGRVLLTMDKDFGALCFRRGLPSGGVVLIRSRSRRPQTLLRLLLDLMATTPEAVLAGSFTVVSDSGVRRRPL